MATTAPAELMTAEEFFEWANRPENAPARLHVHRGRVFPALPPSPNRLAAVGVLSKYVIKQRRGEVAWMADGVLFDLDPLTVQMPDMMLFVPPSPRDDFPPRITTEIPVLMVEVCDVGSPSRALQRCVTAIEHGVQMVWHLFPEENGVTVYLPKRSLVVLDPNDEVTGFDVLPDFRCKVADLFTLPGQPPAVPTA